ncbi:MAG TPA: aspartate aminotransferase, partial [Alcanivorax sp.]|nr:aspartate aminotransferase [Alcanivorax sp.]
QTPVRRMVAAYRRRHDHIVPALNEIPGVHCPRSDGTFYAFPDVREAIARLDGIDNDRQLAEALLHRAGVAVVPGSGFGAPGRLRVSFAADMHTIETGLRRLREFLR